jgi:hypothetical protein
MDLTSLARFISAKPNCPLAANPFQPAGRM